MGRLTERSTHLLRRSTHLLGLSIRLPGWLAWGCFLVVAGSTVAAANDWQIHPEAEGCIGGRSCNPRPIEVRLRDQAVKQVRFFAMTSSRDEDRARLLVTLDGRSLDRELSIDVRGRTFTVDVRGRRGRLLRFETLGSEGVRLEAVEVLYASAYEAQRPREPSARTGPSAPSYDEGWRSYRNERGCIGGELCNQDSLIIRLDEDPVERIRFEAHDDFGQRFGGRLRVQMDDRVLARQLEIERRGSQHQFELGGRRGDYLVFEALNDDEVMVSNIEILYRRPGLQRTPPPRTEYQEPVASDRGRARRYVDGYDGPGDCIGGRLCDDLHRLEILLRGLAVEAVRFHAHSDVGDAYDSRLRLLLDREVVEDELEIPRWGEFYTFELDGQRGRRLTFEAVGRGEVVIESIEVRYEGEFWSRHRTEDEPEGRRP